MVIVRVQSRTLSLLLLYTLFTICCSRSCNDLVITDPFEQSQLNGDYYVEVLPPQIYHLTSVQAPIGALTTRISDTRFKITGLRETSRLSIAISQCEKQGSYLLRLVDFNSNKLVLQTQGSFVE